MWGRVLWVLLLIVLGAFFVVGNPASEPIISDNLAESASLNDSYTHPVCLWDIDCGQTGYTDFGCWKDFIYRDFVTFTCLDGGMPNASCSNSSRREFIDWCHPGEVCVPREGVCQPGPSCYDGLKNQGETYIDCGGPCNPCSSCGNGIKDGQETSVDCGGSVCPACVIQCTSNESCGIPRWGPLYCGVDGSVYQDYVAYECENPGTYDSFCKRVNHLRSSDYCGPLNRCQDGRCVDDEDSDPYHYKDGGYYGQKMSRLVQEYVCKPGDSCWTQDEAYLTCRGDYCYYVKLPD